ncbi:MAG: alpha-1,2-fucosyltransferase [Caulobacteraceae bacterium]|nr:alpha-1,2-fucosyltransferase [Caulobacteraceae bacterium]
MKTVKIQGGLGNQLFGLAFARSVAIVSQRPVALDLSSYERDRYGRGFELAEFSRNLGAFVPSHRPLAGSPLAHIAARFMPTPGFVAERKRPADEAALRALVGKGDFFSGYWQDEAYMLEVERLRLQTRRLFETRGRHAPAGLVVIHYRTYQEERRRRARRTPPGRFFADALDQIEAKTGPVSEVALISDDVGLARRRLGDLGRPIIELDQPDAWSDLAVMVRARALVLSNSSFSWWGGFCSAARAVIYPSPDGYAHYPRPSARFIVL